MIEKYASERRPGQQVTGVDQEVDRLLYGYSWPGNVRELENAIERAMVLCPGNIIRVSDLPKEFKKNISHSLHLEGISDNAQLYETLDIVEKAMIERALTLSHNVQSHAAELLGIGKSGLNQKIKKYGLKREREVVKA